MKICDLIKELEKCPYQDHEVGASFIITGGNTATIVQTRCDGISVVKTEKEMVLLALREIV